MCMMEVFEKYFGVHCSVSTYLLYLEYHTITLRFSVDRTLKAFLDFSISRGLSRTYTFTRVVALARSF